MKIGVVTVPYITNDIQMDLAISSLETLTSKEHELLHIGIVNKWRTKDSEILDKYYDIIETNDKNILARAWNKGVQIAIENGCEYILIPNLDIVAEPTTIDTLVHEAAHISTNAETWSAWNILAEYKYTETANTTNKMDAHSFFMIHKSFVDKVGPFDENFIPAYGEDVDIQLRMDRLGYLHKRVYEAKYIHFRSQTIRASDNPIIAMDTLQHDGKYWREKWGCALNSDTTRLYKHPFNLVK